MGLIDITGQRFGALRALSYAGPVKYGRASWHCVCDCGQTLVVASATLRRGMKKACCLNGHFWARETGCQGGLSRLRAAEYRAWYDAIRRCTDPAYWRYADYGGRGIKVCERWAQFKNFYADMGDKPTPEHMLDRFPDNNGNYEPANCRWATREQQRRNMRSSIYVEYGGKRVLLLDVLERHNVNRQLVRSRLNVGWTLEDALTVPARPRKKNRRRP